MQERGQNVLIFTHFYNYLSISIILVWFKFDVLYKIFTFVA